LIIFAAFCAGVERGTGVFPHEGASRGQGQSFPNTAGKNHHLASNSGRTAERDVSPHGFRNSSLEES